MIKVDVSKEDAAKIKRAMAALSENDLHKALGAAGRRATRHAVTEGTKKLREVYTVKAGVAKSRVKVERSNQLNSVIRIEGGTESVRSFRGTRSRKDGVFVSIKKGGGGLVPRSFTQSGVFLMREGADRYPLKGIYGPSVPQMFGEESVLDATMTAAMEMYEKRIIHEIERRAGGAS